jgi:drug/metabolite transporter (DMT)-like permease
MCEVGLLRGIVMSSDPVDPYVRYRNWIIPGMLLFGTCTTLTQKFMIEQKEIGVSDRPAHKFNKPWYLTLVMFIGMFCALIVYEISNKLTPSPSTPVDYDSVSGKTRISRWKPYFMIAIPACCDLIATGIMNIGLLYLKASIWQMLRGAMVVFSSLLHAFVLKREYRPYMWMGVCIVTIAIVVVGLAAVCSSGVAVDGVSDEKVVLAIVLTVGSQFVRAVEIVVEDYLLHDHSLSAMLIVGVKGFWGTLITGFIVLPAIQYMFTGTDEGNGIYEDTLDTFYMLGKSSLLIGLSVAYVFFILGLNAFAMMVTHITNAVMRTIMECIRTLCIWIAQLILFYSIQSSEYGRHHPTLGESWTEWSWMQLAGFALLITGMLVYNRSLFLPGFDYREEKKDETTEQTDLAPKPLLEDDDE